MRILYLTESLLPHVDGVSLTLARLYASLVEEGVEFRVLSPFVPGPEVEWADRVRLVPYLRFPLYPDYRVSLPWSRLGIHLDEWSPDLVHVVSPTPFAWRGMRAARRRGIPVVSSFHTNFVSYFRYYRVRPLESLGWALLRRFYAGCETVFAPSEAIIRELASQGIGHAALWSRGIDDRAFAPARRDEALRRGVPGDGPIVLFVGRLVREKDLDDLVGTAGLLEGRGLAHRMVLVGDGPMRAELERSLPRAHFAGHQEGEELAGWYASADVFLFPSTTETFGNVVLEALASGLPAVVSNRGGVTDLVRDGETGRVVPANDPGAFADAIEGLLADPATLREMGERGRAFAAGRSWHRINRGLIDRYRAITAAPGAVAR